MLNVTELALPGVFLLEYTARQDNRAVSFHTFSREHLRGAGITVDFCEEISYRVMKKDTLYGIHFQNHPKPQSKLLSCAKGRILDYAVDLRRNSSTFKQFVCAELTAENRRQLFIPAGFGHAALTLEDNTHIVMRIDKPFEPELSRAIRYDDAELNLGIPVTDPILSVQDSTAPALRESCCNL